VREVAAERREQEAEAALRAGRVRRVRGGNYARHWEAELVPLMPEIALKKEARYLDGVRILLERFLLTDARTRHMSPWGTWYPELLRFVLLGARCLNSPPLSLHGHLRWTFVWIQNRERREGPSFVINIHPPTDTRDLAALEAEVTRELQKVAAGSIANVYQTFVVSVSRQDVFIATLRARDSETLETTYVLAVNELDREWATDINYYGAVADVETAELSFHRAIRRTGEDLRYHGLDRFVGYLTCDMDCARNVLYANCVLELCALTAPMIIVGKDFKQESTVEGPGLAASLEELESTVRRIPRDQLRRTRIVAVVCMMMIDSIGGEPPGRHTFVAYWIRLEDETGFDFFLWNSGFQLSRRQLDEFLDRTRLRYEEVLADWIERKPVSVMDFFTAPDQGDALTCARFTAYQMRYLAVGLGERRPAGGVPLPEASTDSVEFWWSRLMEHELVLMRFLA
jgi:hypothetical protein